MTKHVTCSMLKFEAHQDTQLAYSYLPTPALAFFVFSVAHSVHISAKSTQLTARCPVINWFPPPYHAKLKMSKSKKCQ